MHTIEFRIHFIWIRFGKLVKTWLGLRFLIENRKQLNKSGFSNTKQISPMTIVTAEAATAAADIPKLLSSLQIQFQLNPLHRMHYFPTAHVSMWMWTRLLWLFSYPFSVHFRHKESECVYGTLYGYYNFLFFAPPRHRANRSWSMYFHFQRCQHFEFSSIKSKHFFSFHLFSAALLQFVGRYVLYSCVFVNH